MVLLKSTFLIPPIFYQMFASFRQVTPQKGSIREELLYNTKELNYSLDFLMRVIE